MDTAKDDRQDLTAASDNTPDDAREVWVKPEITDFQPVTVARGISYRIGDGISNLC